MISTDEAPRARQKRSDRERRRTLRLPPHELTAGAADAGGDRLGVAAPSGKPVGGLAQRSRSPETRATTGGCTPFEAVQDDPASRRPRIESRR